MSLIFNHAIESFNLNIFARYDFHFSIDLMNLYLLLFFVCSDSSGVYN
ncbi:hypothetical protein HMPREF1617_00019 [Escherichia coli 908675]|nr:hypothetical protein ECOK1_0219 [Escherichia coli IHE3034]AJB38027.1 hypothetical protein L282_3066 [Escherichia coli APEC IMT5155]EFU49093.1 hypothetical protein HMPREF9539_00315 [Escherichia coli MS 110-3]EHG02519.1 hypothetical protein i01_00298 [Escherichia coli cloneA_i1]ESE24269.1 hypothetical protein HMPREF1617_00019 [Escherichia coli 908675]ESE27555.1 hypothetical protein HMPREF1623_00254 [Escherichia coli 910096-2]EZJ46609.1 hypothetical protein AD23_0280 [Escherichia coli 2-005-0